MGDAFDDYMERMDDWEDFWDWYPDNNEQAVEVFKDYRVPDDQTPDKFE
jgi:hypothetical protein